jgi:tetratricopeptide (TPR) repeat protein
LLAAAGAVALCAPASPPAKSLLVQANAAFQAGEADKARALLNSLPPSGDGQAEARSLQCRVELALEHWDAAVTECEQAVRLEAGNSDYHLWLGRALGGKADRASFLSAYSLAKRVRSEFEESVQLNPRNAEALSDLGEYYYSAPGVVGGGAAKAEAMAAQLDKLEPARAHELRGHIAAEQKDYAAAEREFKAAIATGAHPAFHWVALASFYRKRGRFDEMDSAIRSAIRETARDKHAGVALYDGASVLIAAKREPELAVKMLEDYLAAYPKTEEAPAFVAHTRLARLKLELGDQAAASREQAAALELAHDYKPAQDLKRQETKH